MTDDRSSGGRRADDRELEQQLVVFAREVGELYSAERLRTRELERALDDLRETYVATMRSLATVVEAKDVTTHGHLERTERYGLALASAIDPALAARPEVAYGFFLHDIGKVGVPEPVLRKAGSLEPAEWALIREHPTVGARIVEPIRFLGDAVEIVRCHHECWDGSGYPQGLRGPEIPLAARIFAVADAFDAMTSDRPYREAMPLGHALDEIAAGAGVQFDPRVVEAFLDLVHEHDDPLGIGRELVHDRAG